MSDSRNRNGTGETSGREVDATAEQPHGQIRGQLERRQLSSRIRASRRLGAPPLATYFLVFEGTRRSDQNFPESTIDGHSPCGYLAHSNGGRSHTGEWMCAQARALPVGPMLGIRLFATPANGKTAAQITVHAKMLTS
jgi:hypothetical protein